MSVPLTQIAALARTTYLEARRNRVTIAVVAFALLIVVTSVIFQELTTTALDRIVRDMALAAINAFGLLLAVFLGVSVISREIDRKTVYMLVSKPLSRGSYVVGKVAGVALTLGVTVGLMVVTFLAQQVLFGEPLRAVLLQTCWLIFAELLVVASFAVFMSTFSSPIVSAFGAVGLFLIGELSTDLLAIAQRSKSFAYGHLLRAIFYLVPNFDHLNLKTEASLLTEVGAGRVASGTLYAAIYIACFTAAAAAVFSRRDLK